MKNEIKTQQTKPFFALVQKDRKSERAVCTLIKTARSLEKFNKDLLLIDAEGEMYSKLNYTGQTQFVIKLRADEVDYIRGECDDEGIPSFFFSPHASKQRIY